MQTTGVYKNRTQNYVRALGAQGWTAQNVEIANGVLMLAVWLWVQIVHDQLMVVGQLMNRNGQTVHGHVVVVSKSNGDGVITQSRDMVGDHVIHRRNIYQNFVICRNVLHIPVHLNIGRNSAHH